MRHHGRGRGMGRGRYGDDDFAQGTRRGGLGLHLSPDFGSRYGWPSTRDRIQRLEEAQRELEQMAADVASELAELKRQESEAPTP